MNGNDIIWELKNKIFEFDIILINEGYKIITVLLFFVALALFGSKIVF